MKEFNLLSELTKCKLMLGDSLVSDHDSQRDYMINLIGANMDVYDKLSEIISFLTEYSRFESKMVEAFDRMKETFERCSTIKIETPYMEPDVEISDIQSLYNSFYEDYKLAIKLLESKKKEEEVLKQFSTAEGKCSGERWDEVFGKTK